MSIVIRVSTNNRLLFDLEITKESSKEGIEEAISTKTRSKRPVFDRGFVVFVRYVIAFLFVDCSAISLYSVGYARYNPYILKMPLNTNQSLL